VRSEAQRQEALIYARPIDSGRPLTKVFLRGSKPLRQYLRLVADRGSRASKAFPRYSAHLVKRRPPARHLRERSLGGQGCMHDRSERVHSGGNRPGRQGESNLQQCFQPMNKSTCETKPPMPQQGERRKPKISKK